MENEKDVLVILTKGKYPFKKQQAIYEDKLIASGSLSMINYLQNDRYKDLITNKIKPGDTHFLIIEK